IVQRSCGAFVVERDTLEFEAAGYTLRRNRPIDVANRWRPVHHVEDAIEVRVAGLEIHVRVRELARGAIETLEHGDERDDRSQSQIAAHDEDPAEAEDDRRTQRFEQPEQHLKPSPDQRLLEREISNFFQLASKAEDLSPLLSEDLDEQRAG